MKSKLVLASALVGILALGAIPGHAGSAQVTYVATLGQRISSPAVPVGIGGYAFTTPQSPTSIHVQDLNGTDVGVVVCQENEQPVGDPNDVPNICGDGDDVRIEFCTGANPRNVSGAGFRANSAFTVFVFLAPGLVAGCDQPGSAGTITVNF